MMSYKASVIILVTMAVVVYSGAPSDSSEPEFSCPENEVYYKCSQIHCYKNCEHLTSEPACPIVARDCYLPACECIDHYLRNKEGTCVPFKKCENWKAGLVGPYL